LFVIHALGFDYCVFPQEEREKQVEASRASLENSIETVEQLAVEESKSVMLVLDTPTKQLDDDVLLDEPVDQEDEGMGDFPVSMLDNKSLQEAPTSKDGESTLTEVTQVCVFFLSCVCIL
jgi:hypothetical protein